MTDLDPAAVIAEHYEVRGVCIGCVRTHGGSIDLSWPCLPYRLAEALAASEAKVARAQKVAEWLNTGGYDMPTDMLYTALADHPEQAS